jgi:hypothetical protein
MIRRRLLTVVGALCTVVGLALSPSAASADPASEAAGAGTQGCQAPSATFQYVYYSSPNLAVWNRECSGDYPLNSNGFAIEARGWSGYIWAAGVQYYFCNNSIVVLDKRRVTRIVLAATRISECQPFAMTSNTGAQPLTAAATSRQQPAQ